MTELMVAWYGWLSRVGQGPVLLIDSWIQAVNVPMVSALLFGLIGATSPCQLTTSLSALAFSAKQPSKAGTLIASVAYVLGKVLVYSLVGGLVVLLGVRLQAASIPVVVVARKGLGPLMVLAGLGMLGAIRLRGALGQRWSRWLRLRCCTTSARQLRCHTLRTTIHRSRRFAWCCRSTCCVAFRARCSDATFPWSQRPRSAAPRSAACRSTIPACRASMHE